MASLFKKLAQQQQGSAIVFVSISMLVLLSMTGLVMDVGTVYVEKTHMQKAANAAALSGAQELMNSEAAVKTVVNQIIADHQEEDSLVDTTIEDDNKVGVDISKAVPLTFAGLFGQNTADVDVHAAAEVMVMGRATGVAPLGIDDSVQLEYNVTYKLKVDQTEVEVGNFGVLALGGTGAKTYEDNLRFGYDNEIKINDKIDTQTGNISGKTRSAVQERIDNCPNLSGDIHVRDCSRIILIPVYTPYNYESGQLKSVKVTGFAYFYITEPMSAHDTAITGKFIRRAGGGAGDSDAGDKGAYAIRLTE
ncbi:MAG TPA: Tad domain-containing protein [Bacilli bacterium]